MHDVTASGRAGSVPSSPQKFYHALYFQVLVGVIAGILLGHFWPDFAAQMKPLGDAFVKIVKMMIVPVVFCTIVIGIATVGADESIGGTVLKAMALFYLLTIVALATGLVSVELMKPGVGMHIDPGSIDPAEAARYAKNAKPLNYIDVLLHIIPRSFFEPFAEGEVLPVLFISIVTGLGLRRAGAAGTSFLGGLQSFSKALFAAFGMLMKFAPIGAFGSIGYIVAKNGVRTIGNFGLLIATFYAASLFFVFVVLWSLARLNGFSLLKLLRYIREELLVVLGTASTEPVLPSMLLKLEKLGCSKASAGLTLPLGYSFNLDGTAIYLTLASVFLAQAMDIPLTTPQIVSMILVMLLTSKGAAGVTGSGFAALVATLAAMPDTIPVAGVVLIAGIDRFMSEARALTSLCSNAVACVVIAMWDGACDRSTLKQELERGHYERASVPQVEIAVTAAAA